MAMKEKDGHKVSLDQVIRTMRDTGRDMQARYKHDSAKGPSQRRQNKLLTGCCKRKACSSYFSGQSSELWCYHELSAALSGSSSVVEH
jgi:hypothetical protein